jgi:predicted alpha/beta hydrolase family esterase
MFAVTLAGVTRFLLVPGRGVPFPNHWSRQWARAHRDWVWAPEPPGAPYVAEDRVAALQAVLSRSAEPAILIAHSAGCLTVAFWARQHTGPVAGALLVTPPAVPATPREPLPFRSITVVSRDDPHCPYRDGVRLAQDWGSELFDAGLVGHLDSKSGFGPWPDGEKLVVRLAGPA